MTSSAVSSAPRLAGDRKPALTHSVCHLSAGHMAAGQATEVLTLMPNRLARPRSDVYEAEVLWDDPAMTAHAAPRCVAVAKARTPPQCSVHPRCPQVERAGGTRHAGDMLERTQGSEDERDEGGGDDLDAAADLNAQQQRVLRRPEHVTAHHLPARLLRLVLRPCAPPQPLIAPGAVTGGF